MGLDSLQGCRDKAKLKWWYKVATMPEHRYSTKLFVQEWMSSHVEVGKGSIGVRLSTTHEAEWLELLGCSRGRYTSIVKLNFRCIGPLVK